jgi:4'-phosphopantetheinyl transferase
MNLGQLIFERNGLVFNASYCILEEQLCSLTDKVSLLHPLEIQYFNELQHSARKISYLLGRFTAKNAINILQTDQDNLCDFYIQPGVFQFPVVKNIANSNIQVSISHCDNLGISLAFYE